MRLDIEGDKLFLKNNHAGCMWIFTSVLMLPFIPAIYFLWNEPRDIVPLYFVLPFTLIFVVAAPIMLRELAKMCIVTVEINRTIGEVKITQSAFFVRNQLVYAIRDIVCIEIECSDNDGEFFDVKMVLKNDQKFPILHGNYKPGITDKIEKITEFLAVRSHTILVKETMV